MYAMSENFTNGASRGSVARNLVDWDERDRRNSSTDSRPAEVIQGWLVSRLSGLRGIEHSEIDVREPFASYGLGSTEIVILSGELAEWLGRQLSPALAYEYPTVETLARHLAGPLDASEPAAAVDHEREGKNAPIAINGNR